MTKLTWILLFLMATSLNVIGKEPRDFLDDMHWALETATVDVTALIIQEAFDRAHISASITVDEVDKPHLATDLKTGNDNYFYTARFHSEEEPKAEVTALIMLDPSTRAKRVWLTGTSKR